MNIIIFIHTCKKYEESRAKLIENTWGDDKDIVFITDNESSQLKNHKYIGSYKPGPTYHPENVIKMFNLFINEYNHYDWFMIIDDDSYLYVEKLKLYLSFFDKTESYMIGDFLNWVEQRSEPQYTCDYSKWIGGGPGIVFTKKCIETFLLLIQKYENIIAYMNHDVWLHNLYMSSDKRIKRVDCPGFHQIRGDKLLQNFSKESNHLISIHFNRDMKLLFDYHPGWSDPTQLRSIVE